MIVLIIVVTANSAYGPHSVLAVLHTLTLYPTAMCHSFPISQMTKLRHRAIA